MRYHSSQRNIVWTVLFSILLVVTLNACGDSNNVTGPPGPAIPGPLSILTASPIPAGSTGVPYNITLAPAGGAPPYTWSLTPGSPALPKGLTLDSTTGNIVGTPTATGTIPTVFRLQDSKENGPKIPPDYDHSDAGTIEDSHTVTSTWNTQPALRWYCLKRDWWQVALHMEYYQRCTADRSESRCIWRDQWDTSRRNISGDFPCAGL